MKWFASHSIQSRLVKLLGLSIGITAIMAVVIWRLGIVPALRLALIEKQQEIARRASEQIDNFLEQRISELQSAIKFGLLSRAAGLRQKEELAKLLPSMPQVASLSVIDVRGQASLTVAKDGAQDQSTLPSYRSTLVFTEGRQGRVHVSEVLYSSRGEPFVTIGIPIRNLKAEVEAVLAAEVSLGSLWSSISTIKVGRAGQLYIVSPGGILIAHRDPAKVALNLNLANLSVVSRFISRATATPHEIETGENGKLGLSSYSIVLKTGWGVVAEEAADTALAPIRRVEWLASALLLFTILGSFVLSHRFSLRITRPIRLLEKGTQLISQGQLNHKVVFHTGDEVQSLAENFNRMADALRASYDDLETKISERTNDISGLYAALAPVKPSGSLPEMFGGVIERLLEATGADAAWLRLKSSDDRFVEYAVERGLQPTDRRLDQIARSGSAAEGVFTRGSPIVSTDVVTDFRFRHDLQVSSRFRSCAILPLIVSGKLRGIIQVASRTPGYFKPEKQDHLMAITRQMGVTIENHELFLETERHRRDSDILYTTTDAVRRSLHVPILANTALITVLEKFGFAAGCIYLMHEDDSVLRLAAHKGLPDRSLAAAPNYSPGEGWIGRVFAKNEPVVFPDIQADPQYAKLALPFEKALGNFKCAIGFPITIKNRPVGVFYLYDRNARELPAIDVNLLLHIGKQVGAAVENAWLYEKAQRSLARIRALHEIDNAIASSLDLDTVLSVLLEKVEVFLLHKGACVIHLFNHHSGSLEKVACHDLDQRCSREQHPCGYDNAPQLVAAARACVTVLNLKTDPRTQQISPFHPMDFTSYLGVPLMVEDELLGVLSYFTPLQHPFTNQEIEFLTTLGGQGALAIHKARLYEEIKKQAVDLENSNKIKDDFLCVISHELKTPLLAVSGYTALLTDGILGALTNEQRKAALVIERNCHDLMHMVHSILEATKLQNHTVTIQSEAFSVAGLLEELAQTYDIPRDKPVKICWSYSPDLPPLVTDRDKLKHVLQNLVYNALKFTEEGRVTIAAAYFPDRDEMQFAVSDTGIGIAADQLPLIYEKFRQVDGSANRGYEGAGLGLFIVKEFTQLLSGTVHVESQLGEGSRFTITLPCVTYEPSRDSKNEIYAES